MMVPAYHSFATAAAVANRKLSTDAIKRVSQPHHAWHDVRRGIVDTDGIDGTHGVDLTDGADDTCSFLTR
jgi:hypothetical protein